MSPKHSFARKGNQTDKRERLKVFDYSNSLPFIRLDRKSVEKGVSDITPLYNHVRALKGVLRDQLIA